MFFLNAHEQYVARVEQSPDETLAQELFRKIRFFSGNA